MKVIHKTLLETIKLQKKWKKWSKRKSTYTKPMPSAKWWENDRNINYVQNSTETKDMREITYDINQCK